MKFADLPRGLARLQISQTIGAQQLFQFLQIHKLIKRPASLKMPHSNTESDRARNLHACLQALAKRKMQNSELSRQCLAEYLKQPPNAHLPTDTFMELTVAITGASGAIYAHRTLMHLAASGAVERINLIISGAARTVARVELGVNLSERDDKIVNEWVGLPPDSKLIRLHRLDNLAAKPASGSHMQAGMVIVPCSMGTLGAVASGAGTNLIHRAADVTLKEGRKLVIVPRESPYNAIHLENMLRLARAGARILPASPAFYHRPQSIEEMADHLVFRILDQFSVPHTQGTRWQGLEQPHDEQE